MESEVRPIVRSEPQTGRVVLSVEADSTDDELDAMAEALIDWIESVSPGFFLPEEDQSGAERRAD